ncbi:MAG: crossover junction endodeoxyribonuclease RuvC [Deltaproteobacteria bacterium]|nr:crossover junction endodeoxyribonuclease RuvC [Deltaproteobacteria bacterium]
MPRNHSKILAIDPGTREMGIAFLDDGKLIHFGVKVIKKRKPPHEILKEGRKIILRLIKDFKPDALVVEKVFFANNRSASLLNVFVDEIRAIGRRKGIKVIGYAPSTAKKMICGNGRASKEEVARAVVSTFPELRVFLTQDRKWKARYHQNMFDAVGLGMIFANHEKVRTHDQRE